MEHCSTKQPKHSHLSDSDDQQSEHTWFVRVSRCVKDFDKTLNGAMTSQNAWDAVPVSDENVFANY